MNIFGRGRASRGEEPPKPPRDTTHAGAHDDDSFLTGDERADTNNVKLLLATIAELNSTVDVKQLLVSIVDKAIAVTRAERGFLLLREGSALVVKVARDNLGSNLPPETRFSTKITAQVEASGNPVRDTVDSNAKALELSQSVFDLKIRAVLCVPLCTRDKKTLGVIYIDSRMASREFSPADLKFFAAFASQAAIALENAKLLRDSLEKERMSQELRIAQQIQVRMLPRQAPVVEGLDIAALYEAASEAAGDSYDFMLLPDGSLAFVVTDVSGHGVGPALVTMSSRARLRTYLEAGIGLGEAMTKLNNNLFEEVEDGMFQTVFVGVLDPRDGALRYVNAGHPPPILRRADGAVERLTRSERALALSPDVAYEPRHAERLRAGDVLFAFTDGVSEAAEVGGEGIFGEDRVVELLQSNRQASADELVRAVSAAAKDFAGTKFKDDLTLLCIRGEA
jgi:serine phosphatase RsbU (regulator of sigma subunit)